MGKIITYVHHDNEVKVDEDLKGKHREHCLCWRNCVHFYPDDHNKNCTTANLLFSICVVLGLTTPVWECPKYKENTGLGELNE